MTISIISASIAQANKAAQIKQRPFVLQHPFPVLSVPMEPFQLAAEARAPKERWVERGKHPHGCKRLESEVALRIREDVLEAPADGDDCVGWG